MPSALFSTPRPEPGHLLPALARRSSCSARAAGVPHRRLAARRLGARRGSLGRRACARRAPRARSRAQPGNLAASGVQAFGLFFKSIGLLVVLFAALVADPQLAVAAALTYALAYTFELGLSLVVYFGSAHDEARASSRRGARARRAAGGVRARRVRPDRRVRAARVDPDPPRPAQPLDHEGGRLPDARRRPDDRARPLPMRVSSRVCPTGGRRSARRSTRSPRRRSPSRACPRRRSAAGSRTSRR